jgi:hypothetical protein
LIGDFSGNLPAMFASAKTKSINLTALSILQLITGAKPKHSAKTSAKTKSINLTALSILQLITGAKPKHSINHVTNLPKTIFANTLKS